MCANNLPKVLLRLRKLKNVRIVTEVLYEGSEELL